MKEMIERFEFKININDIEAGAKFLRFGLKFSLCGNIDSPCSFSL